MDSEKEEEEAAPYGGRYLVAVAAAAAAFDAEQRRCNAEELLIERYSRQLQHGCGRAHCGNTNCASSGALPPMSVNELSAKAYILYRQDAKLCTEVDASVTNDRRLDESLMDLFVSPDVTAAEDEEEEAPTTSAAACRARGRRVRGAGRPVTPRTANTLTADSARSSNSSSSSSSSSSTSSNSSTSSSSPCTLSSMPLMLAGAAFQWPTAPPLDVQPTTGTKPKLPPDSEHKALSEPLIEQLLVACAHSKSYAPLAQALKLAFGDVKLLSASFVDTKQRACTNFNDLLKKEDLRALEGECEKDADTTDEQAAAVAVAEESEAAGDWPLCSSSVSSIDLSDIIQQGQNLDPSSSDTDVDLPCVRRVKQRLYALNDSDVTNAIHVGITKLTAMLRTSTERDYEQILHCLVICFEFAANTENQPTADSEFLDRSMAYICHVACKLPTNGQARLARIWAQHSADCLVLWLRNCQTLITLQVTTYEDEARENQEVISLTKFLKILFYANLLASGTRPAVTKEAESTTDDAEDDVFMYNGAAKAQAVSKQREDKLERALQVSCNRCHNPIIAFEEFYNEPLNEYIQMHQDYLAYKNQCMYQDELYLDDSDTNFCFMLYAFILTPATKVTALYFDSRMRMYNERHSSLYGLLSATVNDARPDLKLTVRRDNLISDALIGLEVTAMSNPKDLKKQLVVEFVGEQGIDEGGVSKEFFQLIIEEIFNPDFGMFVAQEETHTMWFNPTSFENGAQFTLVGILIGLAIYNNIILAVNFPMVVYRKLMGLRGDFYDLRDWSPLLYNSLKSMLDYEADDMESVFMQTFRISYKNVFGEVIEHDLLPDGGNIAVEQHNKQQFVALYSDFLLNQCIEQQFKAFKKGFDMVTDESVLGLLFRPEEVEQLVCGSKNFDFMELEKSTEYDGGYTSETSLIKDFWCIVHAMSDESKRKLLEFTTGSDRVPVGGLSHLKLVITRHGPDSERLPTSHTCFNVLLLPEYDSKAKLEERLLKAINYSKGFGNL